MGIRIPFNKPFVVGKELYYIARAVALGNIGGDGHFTQQCCRLLEQRFGIHRVMMVPSCTAALEMAVMLCDPKPGDEVILPSFTFVSTANAVVRLGAKPVFVDVRPDTLNLDEELVERAVTSRTKVIFPVHYAGVSCEMGRIGAVARKHGLRVIEDAAQGVNAFYGDRPLGAIGDLGTYSFHETKNYICGEGGALCVNDPALVERAEILRDKGTNRRQFFRGQVDKYTWVDVGSSYVPSEVACAFLYAQLELMDVITERRRAVYERYRERLAPLEAEGLLRLPRIPDDCRTNYHIFYILLPDGPTRDGLMHHLKERGILAVFHYVPLHSSPMGLKLGYREGQLPVTEEISARLLRLPLFHEITEAEQEEVIHEVTDYLRRVGRPVPVTTVASAAGRPQAVAGNGTAPAAGPAAPRALPSVALAAVDVDDVGHVDYLYEILRQRYARGVTNIPGRAQPSLPSRQEHEAFLRRGPYALAYLATVGGKPVGFAYLKKDRDVGIFVDERCQGRGLGRAIIREMLDRHPELDYVTATVNSANAASCRLFEALGFREAAHVYYWERGADGAAAGR